MNPTISVIINTLNRGDMLEKILHSFKWLKYDGEFEVIVVNGPSTDNTDQVIDRWKKEVRVAKCPDANLSMSRNIGIELAKGEIVIFIDDDAYPEPEWLIQMVEPFSDSSIGAVGGIVYDHTGYSYQYEYRTANRQLNCNWSAKNNALHLCYPYSFEFPYPPGGNAAYRKTMLIEVGGFDEEIEYYGDETDVAVRLVDAGYFIKNIVGGYIHHKSAPSNIRNHDKIIRNWYPILKNKIYFSVKNALPYVSLEEILSDNEKFASMWREDVKNHVLAERLTADNLAEFESQNARAFEVGISRGLSKKHKLLSVDRCNRGEFLKFQTIGNAASKAIVLVSQFFPPDQEGGIPTLTKELSESLAAEGNIVHVVTQSADINRVDLENGVWIHRVLNTDHELNDKACSLNIPQRIWNWSATAHSEVKRISEHREISVVEAPVWDCQGIAFLLNRQWPLITSLQTTLHFWLDTHDELRNDSDWMAAFGSPMLRLEKMLMMKSDGIRSISAAIKCDVESAYSFAFDDSNVQTSPLGMSPEQFPRKNEKRNNNLKLLFVGRLEPRKGIDVLLSAILIILKNNANVNFQIIGDDSIQVPGKQITYKNEFLASQLGKQFSNRVSFEGRVNDLTLRAAYRDCDVFISPSRFESFGLVFLEAMREAKPVIGCNVGGMPEIISDKKSGLLVTPGNIDELASAIQDLIDSPKMRKKMGENGRAIFLEKFTAEVMARSSLPLYEMAQRNYGMKFK